MNLGPSDAVWVTDGDLAGSAKSALLDEAQVHVRPMRIAARPVADGFAADLVAVDGSVAVTDYGAGPDELLAVLVAEQRYLVEQEGRGSVAGATYLDKARACSRWPCVAVLTALSARSLATIRLAGAKSVGLGAGLEDVGVEGDAVDDRGDQSRVGEH